MKPPEPGDVVRSGYDQIAERYTDWATGGDMSPGRVHALAKIEDYLPAGATILDLGCGAGIPMTRRMAERYRVRGIDISAKQIELARRNVPHASFERDDMTKVHLPAESLDGVVAFYSLTHLDRADLAPLLARINTWLRPGGVLIASLGVRDSPGAVDEEWLGVPMYFSGFDVATNKELVAAAAFEILDATVVADPEHGGFAEFLWIAARRSPKEPAAPTG